MDTLHFPGRDVPPYAECVSDSALVEGRVYYRLHFLDDEMTIPELEPFVFIGRNLADDGDSLYFQDAASYLAGVRYGKDTGPEDNVEGEVHTVSCGTPFVYEFEKALERLLYCSIERSLR